MNIDNYYSPEGVLTDYTSDQSTAKAYCQGSPMVWSDVSMAWVDGRSLAQIKDAMAAAIKARRDARLDGGTKVGEKWFHSDSPSRIQQLGLVIMGANIPAGLMWKTMDKSFVSMTQTLAMQVFAAVAASDSALYTKAEQIKSAMLSSASPASFDYTTGWPLVYGEIA